MTASTETVISPTKDISSVCTDLGTTAAKQLLLAQLPATVHGIKRKRFQKACYTGRPWIEYSVQLDACFCYCCRTFTKETDLAAQLLNLACVRCAWLLCDFSVSQRIANFVDWISANSRLITMCDFNWRKFSGPLHLMRWWPSPSLSGSCRVASISSSL